MPESVLASMQRDLVDYRGRGLSVLEMSHRSSDFIDIAAKAEADLRKLLLVPDDYAVLFMQGGASSQFALTVSNLDINNNVAFADTGYWSKKAIAIASQVTTVNTVISTTASTSNEVSPSQDPAVTTQPLLRVPAIDQWADVGSASYLHITDNETIDGVLLNELPSVAVPLVADMSSSILSRPIDVSRYGVIYAGAQKNIGPAGITVIIVRKDLLERCAHAKALAPVFNYQCVHDAQSMLNTPPTFAWYAAGLVFEWLLEEGGLDVIAARNKRQADLVYSVIDNNDAYINSVHPDNRSVMNIAFSLSTPARQDEFLQGCETRGLLGLKGHKSVGGLRASLYNAIPDEAVHALVNFMNEFSEGQGA